MIYFAHAVGTDLVKIGFTAGEPAKRLKELQTGCPQRLELLAAIEGTEADEGRWHRDFATDRSKGEWFRLSAQLAIAIIKAATNQSPKKQLFAFQLGADGFLKWSGAVEHESGETIRLDLFDAMGFLSGEMKDVPRNECRIFSDIDSFNRAITPHIERILARSRKQADEVIANLKSKRS